MAKKTVKFNQKGIEKLPQDKPVIYTIKTTGGKINYAGIAKKGRVGERIGEHLTSGPDPIPGVKVKIVQMPSIAEAKTKETKIIATEQPKYNKQGK